MFCIVFLFLFEGKLYLDIATVGKIDKTMPISNHTTKAEKHECRRIHEAYDHLIPGHYSKLVQERLAEKGIHSTMLEIQNARRLNRYDLEVMLELEKLALIEKEKLERKLSGRKTQKNPWENTSW